MSSGRGGQIAPVDAAERHAIDTEIGATLFVEAGAGAGKTTQLVRRVVNLVRSGVAVQSIAAITFTEAAASELRQRIRTALELDADPAVQNAVAEFDAASITTLHGFAFGLISDHAVEGGLPPHPTVLDEIASRVSFDRRWRRFVDELHETGAEEVDTALRRAAAVGVRFDPSYPGEATLKEVAFNLSNNWDRLGVAHPAAPHPVDADPVDADPAAVSGAVATDGTHSLRPDPIDTAVIRLESAAAGLRSALGACQADDCRLRVRVAQTIAILDALVRAGHDDAEFLAMLSSVSIPKAGNVGRKGDWTIPVVDVRSAVADVAQLVADVGADITDDVLAQLLPYVAAHVLDAATERRRQGTLEFHDLLVVCRNLLRTQPAVRRQLHDRFTRVLLDEFQDTDPLQIEVAMLIAATPDPTTDDDPPMWSELPTEPGRLFFVGDPKQSIYRFRRADIALYLAASEKFTGADGPVRLTSNFRTVEPIVDWLNAVFSVEIGAGEGGAQAPFAAMSAIRRADSGGDHRPVLLGGAPRDVRAPELRRIEAADVAAVVADIAENPESWPVAAEGGGWRPATLADVTILLPTRTSLPALRSALGARSIPHLVATGSLLFDAADVRDVLSVVLAVDDPSDPVPLVAALRSPLYACSDRHLAEFVDRGGRWDLTRSTESVGLSADHPVIAALHHLCQLHRDQMWMPPADLLDRIIRERCATLIPSGGDDPIDRWRRLRVLVDRAQEFDHSVGGGLRDFVRWVELQMDDRSTIHEPILPEHDREAVRIMTIHGAKGLEFPITIVSGLTTQLTKSGRKGVQVSWTADALPEVRLRKGVETARFADGTELDAAMDAHERMRLLYVALTRARDHLVVSAHHTPAASSFGAIVARHAEGDNVRVLPSSDGADIAPDEGGIDGAALRSPAADSGAIRPTVVDSSFVIGVPAAARRRRVASATSLAESAADTRAGLVEPPAVEPPAVGPDGGAMPISPTSPTHAGGETAASGSDGEDDDRRSVGAAVGRAVHWVLERAAFDADRRGHDVRGLVDSAAQLEPGAPAGLIAAMVRAALAAPTIDEAASVPHHREVFLAAELNGVVVEGFVDLLIESADGLVIVDYKTDAVTDDDSIDARVDHHLVQLATYAALARRTTGLDIADVRLIFCRPGGAIERRLGGLAELDATVLALSGAAQ